MMGQIVAVHSGSPAANAGLQVEASDTKGDVISSVEVMSGDTKLRFSANLGMEQPVAAAKPNGAIQEFPLDPVKLPWQLAKWAASNPKNREVTLVVLRLKDKDKTPCRRR